MIKGKAVKKPIVIEYFQFTDIEPTSICEINEFIGDDCNYEIFDEFIYIETLEGTMKAVIGDYIIRGVDDEYYPVQKDIFERTYDKL